MKPKTILRGIKGFFENTNQPKINPTIKKQVIGKSVKKRDIEAYTLGQGQEKIVYFGAIHGNEIGSSKLMIRWANYLKQNLDLVLDKYQIVVIPVLNPDGQNQALKNPEYLKGGKTGRFNSQEVDLNRNFPEKWQKDSYWYFDTGPIPVNAGDFPASEPEVKSFINYIKSNQIKIVWAFHSRDFNIVSGIDPLSIQIAQEYTNMLNKNTKHSYRYIPDNRWQKDRYTGHLKLWLDKLGIPFIEVEMSSRWSSCWQEHQSALIKTLKIC